jgi:predicted RNA binding protein YcfA (HicA-like mRNA interferase family)
LSNKLPLISGDKAIKAFSKAGWHFDRIAGSHAILRKEGSMLRFPCRFMTS